MHPSIEQRLASLRGDGHLDLDEERGCVDGVGRCVPFRRTGAAATEHGIVYWHPDTGAHYVLGPIHDKYVEIDWEQYGVYPCTDVRPCADGVGFSTFLRNTGRGSVTDSDGAIFWHPDTGAHVVYGAILERWGELDLERGTLGYPITDELPGPPGTRYVAFQHGVLAWSRTSGVVAL